MCRLQDRVEDKRDEIVALTQALVRIPAVNPPGDAYTPCRELIGERLRRRGFEIVYIRGVGTPGDSDRYPRTNVICRIQGQRPVPCVHFNGHIDVVTAGEGWSVDRRFLIEKSLSEVKTEVLDVLEALKAERPGIKYDLTDIMEVLPSMTDSDRAVVRVVSDGIEKLFVRPAEHIVSPGTYEQKHINRIGKLDDCIAYGPGRLDLAHQPDEFIEIEDMVKSAQVMVAAAWRPLNGQVGHA